MDHAVKHVRKLIQQRKRLSRHHPALRSSKFSEATDSLCRQRSKHQELRGRYSPCSLLSLSAIQSNAPRMMVRSSPVKSTISAMTATAEFDGMPRAPPARGCHLCLRDVPLPMSPGRTGLKWRKGWDSNPRYPCRHAGFQDRCLKPLGHPSSSLLMSEGGRNCKPFAGTRPGYHTPPNPIDAERPEV